MKYLHYLQVASASKLDRIVCMHSDDLGLACTLGLVADLYGACDATSEWSDGFYGSSFRQAFDGAQYDYMKNERASPGCSSAFAFE